MNSENMFNNRDIARLSLPIFFDSVAAIFMGVIDSAMVSNCGEAVVSGVSIVDTVNAVIITLFSAIATGGAVVISQYIGSGNVEKASAASIHTIVFSTLVGIVFSLPGMLFPEQIISAVYGNVDPLILPHAAAYFRFISIGNPFFTIYCSCSAIFRSNGNTKPIMYVSCLINVLNVIGNYLLIFVADLGAAGAAISTSFCRVVGAALMLYLLMFKDRLVIVHGRDSLRVDFSMLKRILLIAIPTGIENIMFNLGAFITRRFIVNMPNSAVELAANVAAGGIYSLMIIVGNTFGTACMPVIGQCIGAGRRDEAKKHLLSFTLYSTVACTVSSIIVAVFMDPIVGIYGMGEQATAITERIVYLCCIALPLMWSVAAIIPSGLRAAGDIKFPMIVSMSAMLSVRIGLGYIFAVRMQMGSYGIYLAMFCDWIIKMVAYPIRLKNGKWLEKKVI